ncbi:MAG: hypothetical protein COB36_10020 [Alphaproteobacteria bacterium]|nr:MAG: hypothetical protein COB36_10020 [Alphaproteobacteria bacterium]
MKNGRNTKPATEAAAYYKADKRRRLRRLIRTEVLPRFCNKPACRLCCEEQDITKCSRYKGMTTFLDTEEVPTLRGSTRNWKRQMIVNLFKDERD